MIVWITGASSGIGRGLAINYARRSHTVYATARSEDELKELAVDSGAYSGQIISASADITDPESIATVIDKMRSDGAVPDLTILNAGTHIPTPLKKFGSEPARKLMEVNYIGTVNCLEALLPSLYERGHGQIAVVASLAGYRGLPSAAAYAASKAALIKMCESLHGEMQNRGIDLRLINPGFVKTPLTDKNDFPMPFLITVEESVERIVKGLEGSSFEIAFPRRFAFLLYLLKIMPNWLYFKIAKRMI